MGIVEIIVASLVGIGLGSAGTALFIKATDKPPVANHQGTEKAIQQLTELDLTKPICQPSYIAEKGDLLCRELTCLQFSRGLDAQTSGQQCEAISNIANKIQIMKACSDKTDEEAAKDCIELFWKRN